MEVHVSNYNSSSNHDTIHLAQKPSSVKNKVLRPRKGKGRAMGGRGGENVRGRLSFFLGRALGIERQVRRRWEIEVG